MYNIWRKKYFVKESERERERECGNYEHGCISIIIK